MARTTQIRILPEAVVNKIAAGEVVDRPASVLKELMENSLDAGSDVIRVRLEGGRGKLISVADRGIGLSPDDALLALERHSTSKVSSAEDIDGVLTMGFRGEALPSIAAVSRLTLESRRAEDAVGVRVEASGGRVVSVGEAAMPPGTTVTLRSLFFNTPARRKFMRSEPTERGHLYKTFTRLALANPGVRMEMDVDGRRVYTLPPADSFARRLRGLFGGKLLDTLLPVHAVGEGMTLEGFIADPTRLPPGIYQHFFVNRRPVEDRLIMAAVREAFGRSLPGSRRPAFVLYLEIDPRSVDVNVHPTKREVRFHRPGAIKGIISEGLSRAMRSTPTRFDVPPGRGGLAAAEPSPSPPRQFPAGDGTPASEPLPYTFAPGPDRPIREGGEDPELLGSVLGGYLVVSTSDNLLLLDQHAAHERVIFEKVRERLKSESGVSQDLLWSEEMEVQIQDLNRLERTLPLLKQAGCVLDPSGPGSFRILSLPPEVRPGEMKAFVIHLLELFEEADEEVFSDPSWPDRGAALVACHGAVKMGERLGPEETEALVRDLFSCEDPHHCPHGRPTVVAIDRREMEKLFGRR